MSNRAYKLISARWGLESIKNRRLKLSDIENTNDPYELLPFDLSDERIMAAIKKGRSSFSKVSGMICCSAQWSNPVLWAHYAEMHKGLALGFEIDQMHWGRVSYVDKPIKLNLPPDPENFEQNFLFAKYRHWEYESEIRYFPEKNRNCAEDGFAPYGGYFDLVEVVMGAKCVLTRFEIEEALSKEYDHVEIRRAKFALDSFAVIEDLS